MDENFLNGFLIGAFIGFGGMLLVAIDRHYQKRIIYWKDKLIEVKDQRIELLEYKVNALSAKAEEPIIIHTAQHIKNSKGLH